MQLLGSHLMVGLSQELRPKVQVSYWYSLNTRHHIVLSKQGYAKVDVHLPRRVELVVDRIVQEGQKEIVSYKRVRRRLYHTRGSEGDCIIQ